MSFPNLASKRKASGSLTTGSMPPDAKRSKATPTPHAKYWHTDDMVVVQAEQVLFKLSRVRLEKESGWFRDKFADTSERETDGEGNKVYDLVEAEHAVKAADFEVLLDALEDAISYCHNPPSFDAVAAILRVSTALEFTKFREWAVKYLEIMWPTGLRRFSSTPSIKNAIKTARLAHRCQVPSLRKRALYEIARTRAYYDQEDNVPNVFHWDIVQAREEIVLRWSSYAVPSTFIACKECASKAKKCTSRSLPDTALAYNKVVHNSGLFAKYLFDPICGLQALKEADWKTEGFCGDCIKKWKDAWDKDRLRIWDELDGWLGLSEEVIENDEADDLNDVEETVDGGKDDDGKIDIDNKNDSQSVVQDQGGVGNAMEVVEQ